MLFLFLFIGSLLLLFSAGWFHSVHPGLVLLLKLFLRRRRAAGRRNRLTFPTAVDLNQTLDVTEGPTLSFNSGFHTRSVLTVYELHPFFPRVTHSVDDDDDDGFICKLYLHL